MNKTTLIGSFRSLILLIVAGHALLFCLLYTREAGRPPGAGRANSNGSCDQEGSER